MRAKTTSLMVCRVPALLCLQEGNFRVGGDSLSIEEFTQHRRN